MLYSIVYIHMHRAAMSKEAHRKAGRMVVWGELSGLPVSDRVLKSTWVIALQLLMPFLMLFIQSPPSNLSNLNESHKSDKQVVFFQVVFGGVLLTAAEKEQWWKPAESWFLPSDTTLQAARPRFPGPLSQTRNPHWDSPTNLHLCMSESSAYSERPPAKLWQNICYERWPRLCIYVEIFNI